MPAVEHGTAEPLFASEPLAGVSRRRARLPSSGEVAPLVVAYLRQVGGEEMVPPELEAALPRPVVSSPSRSRETAILIAVAVLLFATAFILAVAVLPGALG